VCARTPHDGNGDGGLVWFARFLWRQGAREECLRSGEGEEKSGRRRPLYRSMKKGHSFPFSSSYGNFTLISITYFPLFEWLNLCALDLSNPQTDQNQIDPAD
jgi:hypothetical protein